MMEMIRSAEHDGSRRLMIFSGRSNIDLATRIADAARRAISAARR